MIEELLARMPSRFVFVVGKGGVGKTTTAGALALALADRSDTTHLISTDPAHSLLDLIPEPCSPRLTVEEFDARKYADTFFEDLRAPFIELIERGTYLDAADAASFLDLSIPGIDEVMSALRLVELLESDVTRIVVDTAPTGHTLRLLESSAIIDSWVAAGRAMAEKAGAVSAALVGQVVPLQASTLLDEWRASAARFDDEIIKHGNAVVVTRAGHVVEAETERLIASLAERGMTRAATIAVGSGTADFTVALYPNARGCAGLRDWPTHLHPTPTPQPQPTPAPPPTPTPGVVMPLPLPLPAAKFVWVAGKGGVGKTTCACAIAAALATQRTVCVVSTDPAGSLSEVLGQPIGSAPLAIEPRLFARQIDAEREFARMREQFRASIDAVFENLGLHHAAQLDRRVIESLWDFAPPGIDEIISLIDIIEHADEYDVLIIDSAPTGHFLRLIEMPEIALDWVRALMRLLVKYGASGSLDALAHDLLAFAKRLKQLKLDLSTPGTTAVFVVTLNEPLVSAETRRLSQALTSAGIPIAATIVNRSQRGENVAMADKRWIMAPDQHREIVGPADLRNFLAHWDLHAG
jgi:arsenite-transporting ATPase